MSWRNSVWVALCAAVVFPLIQGCAVGMSAAEVVQAKPDRRIDYEILVHTDDGRVLPFRGYTECPWKMRLHAESGYTTSSPEAETSIAGERWVLRGINCQNELVDKRPTTYQMYRIESDRKAKLYFVAPGGSAQIKRVSFSAHLQPSSGEQSDKSRISRYSVGPFVYKKFYYAKTPVPVIGQVHPVVLAVSDPCGPLNETHVSIEKAKFFDDFENAKVLKAVEEGFLDYDEKAEAWTSRAGWNWSVPLDVGSIESTRPSAPSQANARCIKLRVRGHVVHVSPNYPNRFVGPSSGSVLYIPSERALYRISRASSVETYRWKLCSKPPAIEHFMPGTKYVYASNPRYGKYSFVRQNPDGTFSCSEGL